MEIYARNSTGKLRWVLGHDDNWEDFGGYCMHMDYVS